MDQALADYLRHLGLEKNASAHTVKSYREDLTQAVGFFREKAGPAVRPDQITTRLLRAFLAWLHDQGYARATISRRIAAVRSWCRFLCRQGTLQKNPADGLRGPKLDRKLPHFLNKSDVDRLLASPSADTGFGLRDRAILETLYSAGLRVSELVGIELDDLDLGEGIARVRGKGRRERLALIGDAARQAIVAWLEARTALLEGIGRRSSAVFLN